MPGKPILANCGSGLVAILLSIDTTETQTAKKKGQSRLFVFVTLEYLIWIFVEPLHALEFSDFLRPKSRILS